MELTEDAVRQALHTLEDAELTAVVRDSRVAKYEHRIRTVLNLRRDETAVLCLLFLRGPQTPGELRSRADRLYSFDGLDAVESTLERLAGRGVDSAGEPGTRGTGPLVAMLARHPGSRESRYAHLLGGPVEAGLREPSPVRHRPGGDSEATPEPVPGVAARLAELEAQVAALRAALAAIEQRLAGTEKPGAAPE